MNLTTSSSDPLLPVVVEHDPITRSDVKTVTLFRVRFNLSPSDGSSESVLTDVSTTVLRLSGEESPGTGAPGPTPLSFI